MAETKCPTCVRRNRTFFVNPGPCPVCNTPYRQTGTFADLQEKPKGRAFLDADDRMVAGSLCRLVAGAVCMLYGVFGAVGDFRLLYMAVGLILVSPVMLPLPKQESEKENP